MTKLHSSTFAFLFLSCGLLACSNTESGSKKPGVTGDDAAAVAEKDAAAGRNGASKDAEDDASDSDSFRADAGSNEDGKPDAGHASGSPGSVPETAEPGLPGTFSHIYEEAFKTCRTGCHGMGFSMLNMATRDLAYAALVDQDSNPGNKECAKLMLKRVKPGAPDESLLVKKLDIHAPCGQQMPPGGTLRRELQDEVREWIANGAKDD
ncbi:MAG TPA: hypothetical protein VFN67_35940 [Polyangiales bacterium]|nr:hypothetical protein [Polyangiales bacterium]